MKIRLQPFTESLANRLASSDDSIALYWLGQAGFAVTGHNLCFLIDPYLSDYLARKYEGREPSHQRMMPSPLNAWQLSRLDFIFCTHRHGDHMDPETLPILTKRHPSCRVIVPTAEIEYAESLGLPPARLVGADADKPFTLTPGLHVFPIAAAHERVKLNANGSHHFLGYVIRFGKLVIYHSGDTVPYEGLQQQLERQQIQLALLPVNGRDQLRLSKGIPGNFTLEEAVRLCRDVGIPVMIAHHFGMFAFNTVNHELIDQAANTAANGFRLLRAQTGIGYVLEENGTAKH
jgi:L-ascorbate metabolism protein UlaG (beta-lactamase superfamily)